MGKGANQQATAQGIQQKTLAPWNGNHTNPKISTQAEKGQLNDQKRHTDRVWIRDYKSLAKEPEHQGLEWVTLVQKDYHSFSQIMLELVTCAVTLFGNMVVILNKWIKIETLCHAEASRWEAQVYHPLATDFQHHIPSRITATIAQKTTDLAHLSS